MTRRSETPHLTPEESRWLDGTLPADAARRLERQLAADPRRRAALERYRESMAVWRDDARACTQTGSTDQESSLDGLADEILANSASAEPSRRPVRPREETPRFAGLYAAAALLLVGVGLVGTLWVQTRRAEAQSVRPDFKDVNTHLFEEIARSPQLYLDRSIPTPNATNGNQGGK